MTVPGKTAWIGTVPLNIFPTSNSNSVGGTGLRANRSHDLGRGHLPVNPKWLPAPKRARSYTWGTVPSFEDSWSDGTDTMGGISEVPETSFTCIVFLGYEHSEGVWCRATFRRRHPCFWNDRFEGGEFSAACQLYVKIAELSMAPSLPGCVPCVEVALTRFPRGSRC